MTEQTIEPGQLYDCGIGFSYLIICPRHVDEDLDGSWWVLFVQDDKEMRLTWLWNESLAGLRQILP